MADRAPSDTRLKLLKAVADPTRLAVLDSLAAMILLKRVMRLPLLVIYVTTVTLGITGIGFIFDLIA